MGLKETESNKALTDIGGVCIYFVVHILKSYDVHTSEFAIHSGGYKVRVDNKTVHAFRTDLPVEASKLIIYASAQLIWGSYFE